MYLRVYCTGIFVGVQCQRHFLEHDLTMMDTEAAVEIKHETFNYPLCPPVVAHADASQCMELN